MGRGRGLVGVGLWLMVASVPAHAGWWPWTWPSSWKKKPTPAPNTGWKPGAKPVAPKPPGAPPSTLDIDQLCPYQYLVPPPLPYAPYKPLTLDELVNNLRVHDKAPLIVPDSVPPPNEKNLDHLPFGDYTFEGLTADRIPQTYRGVPHEKLPDAVRMRELASPSFLFYGRPVQAPKLDPKKRYTSAEIDELTIRAAMPGAVQFFANGRRPGPHNENNSDIARHQRAKGRYEYNSRFFQTSSVMEVAGRFALEPPNVKHTGYGLVYVLDPRPRTPGETDPKKGPQVLGVNEFNRWASANRDEFDGMAAANDSYSHEHEVLWANVTPGDIVGAYVIRKDIAAPLNPALAGEYAYGRVVGFIANPHYVRRDPEQ